MDSTSLRNIGMKPLFLDGGMGISIEELNLHPNDYGDTLGCHEILNRTCPDFIAEIYTNFFESGSDLVETNTFGGSPFKLAEWGLEKEALDLNHRSAQIAKEVAGEFGGLVLGSLGPSGHLPTSPDYDGPEPSAISEGFSVQAEGLLTGGADVLIVETSHDFLEMKSAIIGSRDAMERTGIRVPLWGTVSLHMNGRMLMGTGIDAALAMAIALRLDAFGINCATGPREMVDAVRYLADNSPMPIVLFPNAGMPENIDGKAVFTLTPEEFAVQMTHFLKMGVEIIGGCCGTTHRHIAALKNIEGEFIPRKLPRKVFKLSSAISSQDLKSEGSPLVIGERLNSLGSRKFKKLLLKEDWNGIVEIARSQYEIGAQVLDLAVSTSERDNEPGDYRTLVRKLSTEIPLPIMVDSVDVESVRTALEHMPGVPVINSINLENPDRSEKVLKLLTRYGGAVVAMLIDEKGMANTVDRKLEVAEKLYKLVVEDHGHDPGAILFDPLTFTLATGEDDLKNSASATLESIPVLREKYPDGGVVLGISNVSYGLPVNTRKLLNTVFLHHAVRGGLTAAIINPMALTGFHDYKPEEIELAEDLIFNREDDALEKLIEFSEKATVKTQEIDPGISAVLPPEELLASAVIERRESGLEELIDRCLTEKPAPEIVSEILLPAMKEVGDRMNRRETILPHVLRSAEIMKKALQILEPHLGKGGTGDAKKVILATVFGDVHDIGKNLVKSILSNNGFEVIDMGKQVPAREIVEMVKRERPMAVGLSALLVSTSVEMGTCVEALHENNLHVPVIIGGAAVSQAHARKISKVNGGTYRGGVFYGSDAFDALDICRKLAGEKADKVSAKPGPAEPVKTREDARKKPVAATSGTRKPSEPPFVGIRKVRFALNVILANLTGKDRNELHRGPDEIISDVKKIVGFREFVKPVGLYGFFNAEKDENKIIVNQDGEQIEFIFPGGRKKSVPDWFESDDYIFPYVVTLGKEPVDIYGELESEGHLALSHEWAQLCSILAESTAIAMRKTIAGELGLGQDAKVLGVSPGYALWPELSDQVKLAELLGWGSIGLSLTERYQIVPEFSTSGIAVIHPDAGY